MKLIEADSTKIYSIKIRIIVMGSLFFLKKPTIMCLNLKYQELEHEYFVFILLFPIFKPLIIILIQKYIFSIEIFFYFL